MLEGPQRGCGGYWRLWRQECIGAFSAHSDARVRVRVRQIATL